MPMPTFTVADFMEYYGLKTGPNLTSADQKRSETYKTIAAEMRELKVDMGENQCNVDMEEKQCENGLLTQLYDYHKATSNCGDFDTFEETFKKRTQSQMDYFEIEAIGRHYKIAVVLVDYFEDQIKISRPATYNDETPIWYLYRGADTHLTILRVDDSKKQQSRYGDMWYVVENIKSSVKLPRDIRKLISEVPKDTWCRLQPPFVIPNSENAKPSTAEKTLTSTSQITNAINVASDQLSQEKIIEKLIELTQKLPKDSSQTSYMEIENSINFPNVPNVPTFFFNAGQGTETSMLPPPNFGMQTDDNENTLNAQPFI